MANHQLLTIKRELQVATKCSSFDDFYLPKRNESFLATLVQYIYCHTD
jgi:hypothetical protein